MHEFHAFFLYSFPVWWLISKIEPTKKLKSFIHPTRKCWSSDAIVPGYRPLPIGFRSCSMTPLSWRKRNVGVICQRTSPWAGISWRRRLVGGVGSAIWHGAPRKRNPWVCRRCWCSSVEAKRPRPVRVPRELLAVSELVWTSALLWRIVFPRRFPLWECFFEFEKKSSHRASNLVCWRFIVGLIDNSLDQSIDWLIVGLMGRSIGRLIDWLVVHRLIDWLIGCSSIGRLIDWLVVRPLIDWV